MNLKSGNICIVGAGHVGLVIAAGFAELGHRVTCVDLNRGKIGALSQGQMTFFEPGLHELVVRNLAAERLFFTHDYCKGSEGSDFIYIAVDTPTGRNGSPNLNNIYAAARQIGQYMDGLATVVVKSTVPVGTSEKVATIIAQERRDRGCPAVVSCPEFLSQGRALIDFFQPSRVVIGATDMVVAQAVASLYEPLDCPIVICDPRSAEMIKYTHNAFLATKISFINEIACLCEKLGADVKTVSRAIGMDSRIGVAFLEAGLGWGGSCFPKDLRCLAHLASVHGVCHDLLTASQRTNYHQRTLAVEKLRNLLGTLEHRVVGLLGLAFKPNTEDIREAPSLDIIRLLKKEGALIRAYDPQAMPACAEIFPEVTYCPGPYELAEGCDALLLITEWDEFKGLDMRRIRSCMTRPVFVDGRNLFDPAEMAGLGFTYRGVGRGVPAQVPVAEALA